MNTTKKMREMLIDRLHTRLDKDESLRRLVDSLLDWLDEIDNEYVEKNDAYLRVILEQRSQINKLEKEVKRLTYKCDKMSRKKSGLFCIENWRY